LRQIHGLRDPPKLDNSLLKERPMRTMIVSVSLVLAAFLVSTQRGTPALASPTSTEDAELRAKLEERRDTLKELVKVVTAYFQSGQGNISSVLQAQSELLEAELPLAKSKAERISLYEKSLEARTTFENIAQELHKIGRGRQEDYLRAKADRIKVEIDLHNAKVGP